LNKNSQSLDNQLVIRRQSTDDRRQTNTDKLNSDLNKKSQSIDNQDVIDSARLISSRQVIDKNEKQGFQTNPNTIEKPIKIELLPSKPFIFKNEPPILKALSSLDSQTTQKVLAKTPRRSLRWGMMLGVNKTKFNFTDKATWGLSLGLNGEWLINERLGLWLGLNYRQLAYEVASFDNGSKFLQAARVSYAATAGPFGNANLAGIYEGTQVSVKALEIPLEVRYYWQINTRWQVFINGGINSSIYTQQTFKNDFGAAEMIRDVLGNEIYLAELDVKDTQWRAYWFSHLNLGAGVGWRINAKNSLQINPTFQIPVRLIGLEQSYFSTFGLRTTWVW
jgi:hypothetical protein